MRINIGSYTLLIKWGPRIEVHRSFAKSGWYVCDCLRGYDHYGVRELR
jgi:hypothetical protein